MPERAISRRTFLTGGAAALGVAGLAACSGSPAASRPPTHSATPSGGTTTMPTTTPTNTPTTKSAGPAPGPGLTPGGGPAMAVAHGPRDSPKVALTFHLGPNHAGQDVALAQQLLGQIRQLHAPITVFAVGQWIEQHPELVPLIVGDGHELGNHTYTHPILTQLGVARVAHEIDACRDVLGRLAPSHGRYFRPSGTSQATPLILAQAGTAGYHTVVDFDVDPLDYTDPGADAIVAAIEATVQPGSIISLHFGHPGTIQALPRIAATLEGRRLVPVVLSDLLA